MVQKIALEEHFLSPEYIKPWLPTVAEMPHSRIDPHAPIVASVKPSDPSRNAGWHKPMTNPSYQWRDLRSCRSSIVASATFTTSLCGDPFGAGRV